MSMKFKNLTVATLFSFLILSCKKEEPFSYPSDPINDNIAEINVTVREMRSYENWQGYAFAESCFSDTLLQNYARYEFDAAARNGVLRLIPDTSSCVLEADLFSNFLESELAQQNIENLTFEFTFAQAELSVETQMWLSWYYQNLEFDINVGPYLYSLQAPDKKLDGVIRLTIKNEQPIVIVNGDTIFTNYGSGNSDNHFSLDGKSDENKFEVKLHSENTNEQSLLIFKFLRVFYFGIE